MTAGRILMLVGLSIFIIGALLYLLPRLGLPFGRLPGDLRFTMGNLTCLLPLASTLILSILLTLALNLVIRLLNR